MTPNLSHNEIVVMVMFTFILIQVEITRYLVSVSKPHNDKKCMFVSGCDLLHLIYTTAHPDSYIYKTISSDTIHV